MTKGDVEITAKNNSNSEREVVGVVEQLLEDYDVPLFTKKIVIESQARPHSHPVLTLNTRTKDEPLLILKTLIHEQYHWFATENSQYDYAIAYLKEHYEDNGECNKSGNYPDSFWEHIIVCFNTIKKLKELLSPEDVDWIYNQWQPYPKTIKMVRDNFQEIETELRKFEVVAN